MSDDDFFAEWEANFLQPNPVEFIRNTLISSKQFSGFDSCSLPKDDLLNMEVMKGQLQDLPVVPKLANGGYSKVFDDFKNLLALPSNPEIVEIVSMFNSCAIHVDVEEDVVRIVFPNSIENEWRLYCLGREIYSDVTTQSPCLWVYGKGNIGRISNCTIPLILSEIYGFFAFAAFDFRYHQSND